MDMNRYSDRDPASLAKSTPDHWVLFLIEGVALILLGLLAVAVPSIADEQRDRHSGLALSPQRRHRTGDNLLGAAGAGSFLWSLVSALLAIFVGVVLIENKSQDLYGGLLGWPFHDTGPLRLILVLFFLVEGGVSIMFGMEHRRHFSTRWAFIFASGVVDIVLASIIIFALPGTSAWTLGLLVGINMVFGGVALFATGMHARTEWAVADEISLRSPG